MTDNELVAWLETDAAEANLTNTVRRANGQGVPWSAIGPLLGMSKEGVYARYAQKN